MNTKDHRVIAQKHSQNADKLLKFIFQGMALTAALGIIFSTLEIMFPAAFFNTFFLGGAAMAFVCTAILSVFAAKELHNYEKALDEAYI